MTQINLNHLPDVQFLAGSSTLILGNDELINEFLGEVRYKFPKKQNITSVFPNTTIERHKFTPDNIEDDCCCNITETFLQSPREIFYQTIGRMPCFGANLVFVKDVTSSLVEKFDNQNLDGYKEKWRKHIEEIISKDDDLYCSPLRQND